MKNSGKIAVILLLTAAAYSNIFFNQKAVDDKIFIGAYHPSVAEAFAGVVPKGHEGVYRPVRGLIYSVYFRLFGENLFFYHLHSLTVHLISTGLVYLIMRELWLIVIPRDPPAGGPRGNLFQQIATSQTPRNDNLAFIGALLFGLHPIHTESITYIAASMEMTGVMFMLGSFYLYIKIFNFKFLIFKRFKITRVLSLLLALLAFFTYEMTLTLPLLILWYEWTLGRSGRLGGLGRSIGYWAAAGVYGLVRFGLLDIGSRGPYLANSVYLTALTMPRVVMKYISLIIWPVNLTNNHVIAPGIEAFVYRGYRTAAIAGQSIFDPEILISIMVIIIIIFITVISRKKQPLIAFSLGWFFISLLPGLEIIPQGSIMNEKLMYIPSIGFAMALAWGLGRLGKLGKIGAIGVVMIILFYGARTFIRNADWKNDLILWQKDVEIYPNDSAYARFALGNAYNDRKDYQNAVIQYQKSVEINPGFAVGYASLARTYSDIGNAGMSNIYYQKAAEVEPGFWNKP